MQAAKNIVNTIHSFTELYRYGHVSVLIMADFHFRANPKLWCCRWDKGILRKDRLLSYVFFVCLEDATERVQTSSSRRHNTYMDNFHGALLAADMQTLAYFRSLVLNAASWKWLWSERLAAGRFQITLSKAVSSRIEIHGKCQSRCRIPWEME